MSPFLSRLALFALCSLCLCGPASASEQKEPYKIRIVVDVAKHRLLTDVFRQQLQRELKDGLQAALGKLAKVEVSDTHDRLADVRAQGLQKSLDVYREKTGEKVHFVLVDFDGTRYEIQTRQYDGDLLVPSPTVRRDRTRDRAFVSRTAALLLEQDVGLTGTITSEPDGGKRVQVEWRGGGLGVDLSKWIKKGEVLCLANPRSNAPEATLAWTVLQVETAPKDGVSNCLLYSRFKMPKATGLRCMLMGTRSGTLRLRLLQAKKGGGFEELERRVQLEFRRHGFDGEEGTVLSLFGGDNGDVVDTGASKDKDKDKGRFDRLVFVNVKSGDRVRARIPIPLIDDRVVTVPIQAEDETHNEALENYHSLSRNTLSAAQVLADLFAEINALTGKPDKRAEALDRVRQALQRSRDDHTRLTADRAEVAKELEKIPDKDKPSLEVIDTRLKRLAAAEKDLLRQVEVLQKIEKEETDPEKKKWRFKVEEAKGHEKEAEVEQALAIYKEVPEKFRPEGLDKHVEKLEKQWKPVDQDHEGARRFVYKVYPKLSTAEMEEKWEKEIEAHVKKLKAVKDRWGLLKFLFVSGRHRVRATAEADALKPHLRVDDEKPAKIIASLLPKLDNLIRDVSALVDDLKAE